MAFGGSVKLTGESEYRQAIKNCISSLQSMSSALKSQTAEFNSSDKSIKNSASAQKQLTETIKSQQVELAKAKSAYAQYSVALQTQTTRHNALTKEYRNAVTELDRIRKASGENSTEYQKQAQVVDKLEKELIDSTEAMNESKTAMASLKSEINSSNKTIANAEKALNDMGNEAEDSGKQAENASDGFTVLKGALANLASQAVTGAINGLKKLGSALIDVSKQSISSYAQYEQLVGGVETLFKDSAGIVQNYADQAYKTAGISANQYMEQATSFSASLLQGLGGDTKKAAELADLAITDMADNANKMGTSIEMIQNAYQGFAKDNYTMLDNLKLGYGGTKSEMARLVKESGILGKAGEDLTAKNLDQKVSFDQIIQAVHKVQENMGITGTTSKEAASTIEGSVNSMKASWSNLLTAIADDNADLSKSVDEFVDSAITAANNLVPRVKQVVEGIKKLINSIVTEVFPKLKKEIPELKPLIETFEWFIKNKSLVVNAVKLMVGAFAVNKILSFTKSLSDGAKGLLDMARNMAVVTTATNLNTAAEATNTAGKVAGTVATGALTVAQKALNAAWKANPIGLILTGVTLLITLYQSLKGKTNEVTEAEKAQTEAINAQYDKVKENKEAWDDMIQSKQDAIDVGMTEVSQYQDLYDELQGIVDQNGKVKEGYEKRASFITSTLKNALGVEVEYVDGVIQGYNNLTSSIDEVIAKKKAQIILDSQESMYTEAINNKAEATRVLMEAEEQLNQRKIDRYKVEGELAAAQEVWAMAEQSQNSIWMQQAAEQLEMAQQKLKSFDEETAKVQETYDTQADLLAEYAYTKQQYETNMALFHEGKYDEMTNIEWKYIKEKGNVGDAEKAKLEDSIKENEKYLETLKSKRTEANKDYIDGEIETYEKILAEQKENLKQYNSTTTNELKNNQKSWLENAATVLSKLSDKKVEFKNVGNGQVQYYEDGMAVGAPMAEKEAEQIAKDTIAEFDKKVEAEGAGKDTIQGFINGEGNLSLQNTAFSTARTFGGNILSNLKKSLGIGSPSKYTKQYGVWLLQGLGIGIDKEENSVLKQVSDFGKSVISSLNDSLSGNVNMSAIEDIKNNIPNKYGITGSRISVAETQNDISYTNVVEAFKEALSQMKIELDDEVAGEFVERTVTRVVYN